MDNSVAVRRIKTDFYFSVFPCNGILSLVTVSAVAFRSDYRLKFGRNSADSFETFCNMCRLYLLFGLILHMRKNASAAFEINRALRSDSVGRRLENALDLCERIVLFNFQNMRRYFIAYCRGRHENCHAVMSAYSASVSGAGVDFQIYSVIFLDFHRNSPPN